jgi:photosystem II stability/assembly factor-like uncharacterized protein
LPAITDLRLISDSTGFILTEDGLLRKTENAFGTWPAETLLDSMAVHSYQALDASTIWAVEKSWYYTAVCRLWKSTDGGHTCEEKVSTNWIVDKVHFRNHRDGFFFGGVPYGGTIFRSRDYGEHWEAQLLSYPFHDAHFISKDRGFACGGLSEVHFTNGNILATDDGGKNWRAVFSSGEVNTCRFVNDLIGFASMEGFRRMTKFLHTSDGGDNWSETEFHVIWPDTISPRFTPADLCFRNENIGWAVGVCHVADSSGPAILETADGGENWSLRWWKKDSSALNVACLNSIHFVNNETGWAVGDDGLLVRRTTGGHWEAVPKVSDLPLNKVYFIGEGHGFIAGGYLNWEGFQTDLFMTSNGGETWEKVPNFPYLIHDFFFLNTRHGWAVGTNKSSKGVILETLDGGEHWAAQKENLIGPLHALSYRDSNLWAVGDYGLVLRTPVDGTTRIDENTDLASPLKYELAQNYPNPFNPTTVISFQLPVISEVSLAIYNLNGQLVKQVASGKFAGGRHSIVWDATDARGARVASGVYVYRLEAGEFAQTKKLIVLR